MQNSSGLMLYLVFALILAVSYIGIRRQWAPPAAIAAICVMASFVTMMLISLSQGNSIYQAIFVGLIVGGLFSGGILAMAWYFHSNEQRKAQVLPTFDDLPPESIDE
jgi:Na+/H+-translocating membrane pyrophosphatase